MWNLRKFGSLACLTEEGIHTRDGKAVPCS